MRTLSKKKQHENRQILADFLDNTLTDRQFNMQSWTENVARNHCNTVGCAMGWAAMSGQIEDLGWNYNPEDKDMPVKERGVIPIVGGKAVGWDEAARAFFGEEAYSEVFTNERYTDYYSSLNHRNIVAGHLRSIKS